MCNCGWNFSFGDSARLITAFTDDHRNAQPPRDQQRLIAEIGGVAIGFNDQDAASFAAVSAREHVEPNAARLQQFSERNHERSLARTTRRQISDADHGLLQPPRREHAAIEERVSQSGRGTVKSGERIHDETLINWSSAATVLSVAPRWDSSAASAFRPSVERSSPFSISSMKTSGRSASPTMRTALRAGKEIDDVAKILVVIAGDDGNAIERGLKNVVSAARHQAPADERDCGQRIERR